MPVYSLNDTICPFQSKPVHSHWTMGGTSVDYDDVPIIYILVLHHVEIRVFEPAPLTWLELHRNVVFDRRLQPPSRTQALLPKPDDAHTPAHDLLLQAFEAALPAAGLVSSKQTNAENVIPPLAQSAVAGVLALEAPAKSASVATHVDDSDTGRVPRPKQYPKEATKIGGPLEYWSADKQPLVPKASSVVPETTLPLSGNGPKPKNLEVRDINSFARSEAASRRMRMKKAELERAHEHHVKVCGGLCTRAARRSGSSPPPQPGPPPLCPPKSVSICGVESSSETVMCLKLPAAGLR